MRFSAGLRSHGPRLGLTTHHPEPSPPECVVPVHICFGERERPLPAAASRQPPIWRLQIKSRRCKSRRRQENTLRLSCRGEVSKKLGALDQLSVET